MTPKRTFRNNASETGMRPRILSRACMTLASVCLLSAMPAAAQTSRTYTNGHYDFKNYAVLEDAAAGTIYRASSSRYLAHYAYMDHTGLIQRSVFYDNNRNDEDRVVDLSLLPNANRIITVATHDVVNKRNNIRLLNIQADGTLNGTLDIKDQDNVLDIFPMSSLVDGTTLYICGYVTANARNNGSGKPADYRTWREAFVLSFDLTSQAVTNMTRFALGTSNFYYTYGSSGNAEYDYTIALRMKMIDIPRSGQSLIVTGGANYFKPSSLWPGGGLDECVGGTMIATFDPATLVSTYHNAIASTSADITTDVVEYGMGMHYDANSSKLYIQGNYARALNGADGFDTRATNPFVQVVDFPSLIPSANNTALNDRTDVQTGEAWGLQMIEDANDPGTLTIQGMQSQLAGACGTFPYPNLPALQNVNPFLLNITPNYSPFSGIGTAINDWTMIPSLNTTGSAPNGYFKLGGGDQVMAWAPRMMADAGGMYKIIAPVWEPNNSVLEFKNVVLDATRHIQDCQNTDYRCAPALAPSKCDRISATQRFYQYSVSTQPDNPTLVEMPVSFNEIFCSPQQNKSLQVAAAMSATGVEIYPNPAGSAIGLKLTGFADGEETNVVLTDMTGKPVGTLYNGAANAMPKQLSLPPVANGVYQLQIAQNGHSVRTQKLTVLR